MKVGDKLYRAKGLVQHVGVYLGNGKVIHTSPENGVDVVAYDKFSNQKPVKCVSQAIVDEIGFFRRVNTATSTPKGYSLFTGNCEHLANFLVHGEKASPQLHGVMVGSVVSMLVSSKVTKASVCIGAVLGLVVANFASQKNGKRVAM